METQELETAFVKRFLQPEELTEEDFRKFTIAKDTLSQKRIVELRRQCRERLMNMVKTISMDI